MELFSWLYDLVVIYIFPLILVLGILVFIHELGHFLAAKFFGVRVERFSIGFPPRLFGVQIGETDYCISAVPLGGYVKMSGMIDESLDTEQMEQPPQDYEFRAKKTFPKVAIITAGVIMNFLLGIGIFWGVFWFEGEVVTPTTRIEVIPGEIADSLGLHSNDRFLSVNGVEVANWEDIQRELLANLGEATVFRLVRDGQEQEITFNWGNRESKDLIRLGMGPLLPAKVGRLAPDYPAAEAGLQSGDEIVAIGDSTIDSWSAMSRVIRANPGTLTPFRVLRDGDTLSLSITPRLVSARTAEGDSVQVGQIGIRPFYEHRRLSFWEAAKRGLSEALFLGGANIKGFGRVVSGVDNARDSLAGPLAIAKMIGDIAQESFTSLLRMMAMLSVVLAFVNILPIPALDGGHLVIILIEGILKRPLPLRVKLVVQQVGMLLLLMLMVFIFYNDIARFLSN
ncbi:MAG TPA: RIP metalloprotease RseP [Calditrichia bacterium]|nr:RIP metalloprotease RseP [Calditrichota bacterium]HQU74493.1 RIP metalloprotease RseP [Calditrichia bacterium]HQV34133.1 RIP metalloprotease RseP [Calditrichia bacterium]